MRCYFLSDTDPAFNLAAEDYLFTARDTDCFMLWRNQKAVVVGRNQHTLSQIQADAVRFHRIPVLRRITGGGTVYHDLGTVNFTFIRTFKTFPQIDFSPFIQPVMAYLHSLSVPALADGRNDLLADGLKISGNAQHIQKNRILHHGTLLFETDLDILDAVIAMDSAKYAGRGVPSVRSRVTRIREYLSPRISVEAFMEGLFAFVQAELKGSPAVLSASERTSITHLAESRYRRWDWNFGASPPYNFRKSTRTPGGTLDVRMAVQGGIIQSLRIFGDYFGRVDIRNLEARLEGCRHHPDAIHQVLDKIPLSACIHGISPDTLISALF
ncbi:lipoate--protein ligase [Desulfosarcina sp. OttesenSCG-928-B08]|nr:lipoate--protein ligase [Desulfosarcina sp. OttesenSCG-928-B08]